MALRRAQKPSALGDEVTGAINLLVRLLPLVQMILMYHLYFQVCCLPCLAALQTAQTRSQHQCCCRVYSLTCLFRVSYNLHYRVKNDDNWWSCLVPGSVSD